MKYYNWLWLRKRNRAGELNTTQSIQVDFSPLADWHLCGGERLTSSIALQLLHCTNPARMDYQANAWTDAACHKSTIWLKRVLLHLFLSGLRDFSDGISRTSAYQAELRCAVQPSFLQVKTAAAAELWRYSGARAHTSAAMIFGQRNLRRPNSEL